MAMKLYDRQRSGNCYRARLMLALLGVAYERIPVSTHGGASIFHGRGGVELRDHPDQARLDAGTGVDSRDLAFLAKNPRGQVPVLDDDGHVVWDSIAILVYLARKHGDASWLPLGSDEAEVVQWLVLSQNELLYGLARIRGITQMGRPGDLEECRALAHAGLTAMEARLRGHDWLALGRRTIADVACFPYVALAPELGFDFVTGYPAIARWIERVRALPGFVEHDPARTRQ